MCGKLDKTSLYPFVFKWPINLTLFMTTDILQFFKLNAIETTAVFQFLTTVFNTVRKF